jgi:hypothetical protein
MTDKIYNHTEYTEQQEYEAVDVDTFLWWKKYVPTFNWLTMRPSTEAQPNPIELHEWYVEIGWPADTPWDTEEYDYEIQLLSWMSWQPNRGTNNNLLWASLAKSFNKKVDVEEKPEVVEEVKLQVDETSEDTSEEVSEDISEETTTENNEEVVEEIVPDEAPEEAPEEVVEEVIEETPEQPTEEVIEQPTEEVVEEVKEAVEEASNEEENVVDTVVDKE